MRGNERVELPDGKAGDGALQRGGFARGHLRYGPELEGVALRNELYIGEGGIVGNLGEARVKCPGQFVGFRGRLRCGVHREDAEGKVAARMAVAREVVGVHVDLQVKEPSALLLSARGTRALRPSYSVRRAAGLAPARRELAVQWGIAKHGGNVRVGVASQAATDASDQERGVRMRTCVGEEGVYERVDAGERQCSKVFVFRGDGVGTAGWTNTYAVFRCP